MVKDLLKKKDEEPDVDAADGQEEDHHSDSQPAEDDGCADGQDDAATPADATNHWEQYAVQQCNGFASYIDLSTAISAEDLVTALKASPAIQKPGRALIIYDCKSAGESKTHPKFRIAPLKVSTMHQQLRAVLRARMGSAKG